MSRNGSGTYSLPAGNPVVSGTVISSTVHNNTMSDIASALTQSIAADGQTPVTANIPMNSKKLTGLAAATATGDALSYGQAATVTTLTASAQPAFAGTTSGTITGTTSLTTHTNFTEEYDRGGNFAPTTGLFTAPVAGVYHLTANLQSTATGSTLSMSSELHVNGVRLISTATPSPGISGTVYNINFATYALLAANDVVSLKSQPGATSQAITANRFACSLIS